MFFQKEAETMSRREIEALQLERLRHQVDYCIRNVPFYAKRLGEAGITPEKIKSLSDVQYIPMTTKADIRDQYPYGLFAVPMKKIVRIHASSGTTGKPTVVGYTRRDIENWSDCVARLCAAVGVTDEDVAQISFGYGLFTGALGLHYGLEKLGCAVIPISSGNTEKQAMILKDFGTTVLISTPSYAMYMSEVAHSLGISRDELKLRIGLFGSEGCTNELRDKIEAGLGVFSTDNYGMSELMGPGVSGECEHRCGLHINEDHFLAEIIDPETGAPRPYGESGELVITTLTKEGIPLLRYRTKDISRLNPEPCACGRTFVRMDKVCGRSDDMLKIRGVNVFPSQIEAALIEVEEVTPHYMMIVDRVNNLDTLEVQVELDQKYYTDEIRTIEALNKKIAHVIQQALGISAKVKIVEPQTLVRSQGKAVHVIDNRKLY